MADKRAKYSIFFTRIKPVIDHPLVQSFAPAIFNLVFIAIFGVLAIRPTVTAILVLQKTIVQNQQVLDQLEKKAIDLSQGKRNLDSIDPDKRLKIDQAVPLTPSVPFLISSLNVSFIKEASLSGLQVQPVTIVDLSGKVPELKKAGEIDFSFNVQSGYNQILAILSALQSAPRVLGVQSVNLSKSGDTDAVSVSITGKGYYIK